MATRSSPPAHADRAAPAPCARDAPEIVFYDGACGLCHGTVKFVVPRDPSAVFAFAPIGGTTFLATFDEAARRELPDSIVVRTADGRTLVRSSAIAHVLGRLGAGWRLVARLLRAVPRPVRDAGYRGVASIRRRLSARPTDACPWVPPEQRNRFRP